jgi:hypothetical protein
VENGRAEELHKVEKKGGNKEIFGERKPFYPKKTHYETETRGKRLFPAVYVGG